MYKLFIYLDVPNFLVFLATHYNSRPVKEIKVYLCFYYFLATIKSRKELIFLCENQHPIATANPTSLLPANLTFNWILLQLYVALNKCITVHAEINQQWCAVM